MLSFVSTTSERKASFSIVISNKVRNLILSNDFYNGIFPCFLSGCEYCLLARISKAVIRTIRVSDGLITSSIIPNSSALNGFAISFLYFSINCSEQYALTSIISYLMRSGFLWFVFLDKKT